MMVNLLVDLDERFGYDVGSQSRIRAERAGFDMQEHRGAPEQTLAWIDDAFGGAWSGEANCGSNIVASSNGVPAGFATFEGADRRYAWLRGAALESGVCVFGPLGVDPTHRKKGLGTELLIASLVAMRLRGARRALIAAVGLHLVPFYERAVGAQIVERFEPAAFTSNPVRTVVLASGNGSNFQAIADAVSQGSLPLNVTALVANRRDAFAIERARIAGIPSQVLEWPRVHETRAQYDARLLEAVAGERPELVLLLGWMHLLDSKFVDKFTELINLHPSFLPLDSRADSVGMPDGTTIRAFRGAHAVRDALAAGSAWVGASVHGVTSQTDRGPILVRKPLRVRPGEAEASVLERLHPIEHELIVRGVKRWLYQR